jgi:uncharacterized membrane protein YozB (DUF420 family)
MFLDLPHPILLHAGIPIVVSQSTLTLMFVVLAIILLSIGFGYLAKNRENLLQHRWGMTIAVILTLSVVFVVMLPATYNFYTDPDLEFASSMSIVTLIHGIIGVPAILLGLLYAFGDLPQKTRKWMRLAAGFWIVTIILGVILFFVMQDILVIAMPGM